jgi:NAD(P)-dependent dehydrogenase (short-subunit alcohol dehydrogenase family)
VQNAGVSQRSLAQNTALSVDRATMEIDYFAVIALTKLLLPSMMARKKGHFVVTSPVASGGARAGIVQPRRDEALGCSPGVCRRGSAAERKCHRLRARHGPGGECAFSM